MPGRRGIPRPQPVRTANVPEVPSDGARLVREALGRSPSQLELERFGRYIKQIHEWRHAERLVGSYDWAWMWENLVIDSLLFARAAEALGVHPHSVLDIGSGAGIPGIPLAVIWPEATVTLVEKRRRRASFLARTARELDLGNVRVIGEQAERVAVEDVGSVDLLVSRCADDPVRLLEMVAHLDQVTRIMLVSGSSTGEPPPPGFEALGVSRPGSKEARHFLVRRRQARSPS